MAAQSKRLSPVESDQDPWISVLVANAPALTDDTVRRLRQMFQSADVPTTETPIPRQTGGRAAA